MNVAYFDLTESTSSLDNPVKYIPFPDVLIKN